MASLDGIMDGTNPKADARLARDIAGAGKVKHTPGPWHLSSKGDGRTYVEGGDTADDIACLLMDHAQSENNANARLIAAAPDLLAACKAIIATHPKHHWRIGSPGSVARMEQEEQEAAIELARAAIAKAGGAA